MGYDFELADEHFVVHPAHTPEGANLSIGGRAMRARLTPESRPGEYRIEVDGRCERIFLATRGDVHFIHWRGRAHRVEALNALERARRAAQASGGVEILRAPMPGTVVEVAVAAGQTVDAGALLMTIESMKLQTAITAPHAAVVAEVFVRAGATFDQGAELLRLEAPTSAVDEAGTSDGASTMDISEDGDQGR